MRCNAFAGALLPRAALLLSSFIMPAPLLAQEAAPRQPVDQNNTPQQPADQNNETAPRQESRPSVGENVAPDLVPETVRATTDAARRYMEIAARGGWPRFAHPVPVVWAYMTGWAEPDGMARFRSDIYGLDKGTRLPPAHETPMALRR